MKKYIAEFPMKYGDPACRVYSSSTLAIRVAREHYESCQSCGDYFCSVTERDTETGESRIIFELG